MTKHEAIEQARGYAGHDFDYIFETARVTRICMMAALDDTAGANLAAQIDDAFDAFRAHLRARLENK